MPREWQPRDRQEVGISYTTVRTHIRSLGSKSGFLQARGDRQARRTGPRRMNPAGNPCRPRDQPPAPSGGRRSAGAAVIAGRSPLAPPIDGRLAGALVFI